MKYLIAAVSLLLTIATGASAATIDFDFGVLTEGEAREPDLRGARSFTVRDLTVRVGATDPAVGYSVPYVERFAEGSAGFGSCSSGLTATGECAVSGEAAIGPTEAITLTFSRPVRALTNLRFHDASGVSLAASDQTMGYIFYTDAIGFALDFSAPFHGVADSIAYEQSSVVGPSSDIANILFIIGIGDRSPDYFLSGFSVEVPLLPTPLPAGGLLLLGGLAAIGAMRRHRSRDVGH